MTNRVSSHAAVELMIARLQAQTSQVGRWQDQITSGLKLARPSQGPAEFVELRSGKALAAELTAFRANINETTAVMNQGVAALQEAQQVLVRAHAIAVEGANAATDDAGRAALAIEVDYLIDRLIAAGNARIGDRYLFGGTDTSKPPFRVSATDASGRPTAIVYEGSSDRGRTLIADGQKVDVFYAGDRIFQAAGAEAFQALIDLRDRLRDPTLEPEARTQGLTQSIETLQNAQASVLAAVGEQAGGLEAMQLLSDRLSDLKLATDLRTSELESTDIAEAVVRLQELDNLYRATLGVVSRLFQSNFLDLMQ